MKILCLTPINTKTKTPETGFAELLTKQGHQVIIQYTGYDTSVTQIDRRVLSNRPDIIWAMMEYSLPTALIYKALLNIPIYGHIECIPPWRTGAEPIEDYGYDYQNKDTDIKNPKYYKSFYKDLINCFMGCDSRTISAEAWRPSFKYVTGIPIDADVRNWTYDAPSMEKHKIAEPKQKNQICSIARFNPIKRIHHVIIALSKIPKEIRPTYALIGYGPEQAYLMNLSNKLDVKVKFLGSGLKGLKEKTIQESMFMVQIFSAMPIIEAAYYGIPSISYNTPVNKEVFEDMVYWTECNTDDLADKIKNFIMDKKLREEYGAKAKDSLMNGKANVLNNEQFIEKVEKQLEKARCNFDNSNMRHKK